ncbi:outer membrane protein assembly factor BamE [Halomonas salifodinae]
MIDQINDSEEQAQMQKLIKTVTLSVALTLVSGCSYFGVYKRDLPQGNLVEQSAVEQLQPGMSRNQVRQLMGSPLLEAPFDADQWDYVYRLDKAYDGVEQRRVTLTFAGDRLVDVAIQGDLSEEIPLPNVEEAGPASESAQPGATLAPVE